MMAYAERPIPRRRLQPRRRAPQQHLAPRGSRGARGLLGRKLETEYVDENRVGDHICYISDLTRLRADYPEWDVTISLDEILQQLAAAVTHRLPA